MLQMLGRLGPTFGMEERQLKSFGALLEATHDILCEEHFERLLKIFLKWKNIEVGQ